MMISNDEVHQYIANPDILRSSYMYQSSTSFSDWIGTKHNASVTRLVHRIALISIHYLVHLTEADPGDSVSVFGHRSQQPMSKHTLAFI